MVSEVSWTGERVEKLKELVTQGKSQSELASYFGCSVTAIKLAKHRNKIYSVQRASHGETKLEQMHKSISEADLATRIRWLKGEQLEIERPKEVFSDDQIKRWLSGKDGCDLFCREVLKVELLPYQLEMIDKMINHRRCVFVFGRQAGKDFTIACFVVWQSICNSNQRTLLVSAAQRQSDLLFERILRYIGGSNELLGSIDRSNMEVCRFKNNSEIWSLPATGQIRGYTEVTHVILNEVAHGIPEETLAAVEPMLARKNGLLVLISTPLGCEGTLWNAFNNPIYAKIQLPSTVNPYLSKEWFESQKEAMPAIVYDCEINANFSSQRDTLFPLAVIVKNSYEYDFTSFPEPDKQYFCGVDWGRLHDFSVVTIVSKSKEGGFKVENIISFEKVPFSIQIEHIKRLHLTYHFSTVCAEYAGLGMQACEDLQIAGLSVTLFKPTADSKLEAYRMLLKELETQNLILPKKHQKLQYEMRVFRFEFTEAGKTKLHHPAGGSDDFCDSLAYAVYAAKCNRLIFGAISTTPKRESYSGCW